jgi:hypothetical protein
MPTTKTIDCDEHLLAEAWLAHAKSNRAYIVSNHVVSHESSRGVYYVIREHDRFREALFYVIPKSRYEGVFKRVLTGTRCRARKSRGTSAVISPKNQALMNLLGSWLTKDIQEQTDTWKRLEPVLEENRSSSRKLFS